MTTTSIHSVGYCAHYSAQGDWAFEAAFRLARKGSLQLNVFHFMEDPYDPDDRSTAGLSQEERTRLTIEREKELRLYYDARLGEYLNAGFRLCEDREWTELHRCLCKREFQVLFLACPHHDATFGGKPIAEFAGSFVCPVVLVGPDAPGEYHLNDPAALIADKLALSGAPWHRIVISGGASHQRQEKVTTVDHGV